MSNGTPQYLQIGASPARRRIAVLREPGATPELMWLPGFKSDMASTKAAALSGFARDRGLACTRFDYSGHGQSQGSFEGGTIGRWLEEAREVFSRITAGPVVVVGSSMGGYLALLLVHHLLAEAPEEARRVHALVLIAPAWNMTDALMWQQFPEAARKAISEEGVWQRPSIYGEPYPITRLLIEEGRQHLLGREPWDPGCPVRILHGLLDPDVPWQHTRELEGLLSGGQVQVTYVPDGDHRLSRPQDLELLFQIIGRLVEDRHARPPASRPAP